MIAESAEAHAVPTQVSTPVALAMIVTIAAAVHTLFALESPTPWIIPDELRYAELAKSLGDGSLPSIRDQTNFAFGLGYPLLLAPIWAMFDDIAVAYPVAKAFNALIVSLTALPAYFLARRFLSDGKAVTAALLSVSVPSLLYAGTLMSEVALYPLFVLALLAISVAIERQTAIAQLTALTAIAAVSLVKIFAATLIVAYVASILLYGWLEVRDTRQLRYRLKVYGPTWVALGALTFAIAGGAIAVGKRPLDILGAYREVVSNTDVTSVPLWMMLHIAEFDLYLGIVPFATTLLLIGRGFRRDASKQQRLLVALTTTVCVSVVTAVACYSSDANTSAFGYTTGAAANERAMFVLAPLFFIAFLFWLTERPGSKTSIVLGALTAALLPGIVPLERFREPGNLTVQAFALVPWASVREYAMWPLGVTIFTVGLAGVFLLVLHRNWRDAAVVIPVLAVLVAVTMIAETKLVSTSQWARTTAVAASPTWVDTVAGRNSDVSVLWYEHPGEPYVLDAERHRALWLAEFFNRSIGAVYEIGSPIAYGYELPSTPVVLEGRRVTLEDGRAAPLGDLVFAPCQVRVVGEPVAHDTVTRATLYRVTNPLRVTVSDPGRCEMGHGVPGQCCVPSRGDPVRHSLRPSEAREAHRRSS